tara:strand:+ start:2874 stop:3128 length:255 start_codon:yes stop_codon:yes gene_type:complete
MFTIYSKPDCPFCEKFKQVCELENLTHVVYELGKQFNRSQFYDEFGEGSTFPQVVLDIKGDRLRLGGCQESLRYMQEQKLCCQV